MATLACLQLTARRLPSCLPRPGVAYTAVISNSHQQTRSIKTSRVDYSKPVTILSDLRNITSAPPPALALGIGGLIPFISAPLYMYNAGFFLPSIATAQLTYGATILAFLGGVRWGFLVKEDSSSWGQYTWSVTPSLIAWSALLVPNMMVGYATIISGLVAAFIMDIKHGGFPAWFRGLRFLLSFCAILSLVTSIAFTQVLGAKKQASDYLD